MIRNKWRALLAATVLGLAALLGVQLTATGATTAAAPVITQLSLGPAYAAAGPVKATLTVTATSDVQTSRLIIGARTSSGANVDFGGPSGITITPAGYTFSRTRTLAAGTYKIFGAYKRPGATSFTWLPTAVLKVGAAAPAPDPTPTPGTGPSWDTAGAWNPALAEEFNGTSLDTARWNDGWFGTGITGPVNSAETVRYNSANVSVSGGVLHLKIAGGYGAHINSDGKYSFSRGAVEYRALFPASGGQVANWPALWDNGQSWPADGENDTAEGLSGQVCTYWHASGTDDGACHGSRYAGGWHTYGYEWTSSAIRWYYDGVKVHEQPTTVASPHYLILQNTQGAYGGPEADTDLQVDYVRVWQR